MITVECLFVLGRICPSPLGFWMFDYHHQGKDLSGKAKVAYIRDSEFRAELGVCRYPAGTLSNAEGVQVLLAVSGV